MSQAKNAMYKCVQCPFKCSLQSHSMIKPSKYKGQKSFKYMSIHAVFENSPDFLVMFHYPNWYKLILNVQSNYWHNTKQSKNNKNGQINVFLYKEFSHVIFLCVAMAST